jgi:hypothetical protein
MTANYSAFYAYACGLTFFVLAGMGYVLNRRDGAHRGGPWLVGFAVAQGLVDWFDVLAIQAGPSAVYAIIQLALQTVSLMALVEFDRCRLTRDKLWQGRWIYLPLAASALFAAAVGPWSWFELAYRVLLVWQGGLIVSRVVYRAAREPAGKMPSMLFGASAMAYLMAAGFQLQIPRTAALLAIAALLWLVDRREQPLVQRGSVLRQCRWPVAFCVLLFAGWCVFATMSPRLADEPPGVQDEYQVVNEETGLVEVEPTVQSDLVVCAERGGLAIAPILVLVLLLWMLSRLPSAH